MFPARWHTPWRGRAARAACVLSAAGLFGCSSGAASTVITVKAPENANRGKPVYMLVRSVDDPTFTADSYGVMAPKVVAPDDTVLKVEVIYPGSSPVIEVTDPEKGDLGVYFFFTNPGSEWKTLVRRPFAETISIVLGEDSITK